LKTEHPSPETILAGEATPGHCYGAEERAKGKKTLCWSNKAAGQERVWCVAKTRKEKDRPCKKTAELLQQFSGLPRFGKHSLICVPV